MSRKSPTRTSEPHPTADSPEHHEPPTSTSNMDSDDGPADDLHEPWDPNSPPIYVGPWKHKPGDKEHFPHDGIPQVVEIQQRLRDRGIPSCLTGDFALRYYAAPLVLGQHFLVVPTARFADVRHFVLTEMTGFRALPLTVLEQYRDEHHRPVHASSIHVEHVEKYLHMWFVPADVLCLESVFEDPDVRIVRDPLTNATVPALKEFVQSALDRPSGHDLEDIIDSMNLDSEWAASVRIDFTNQPSELWPNGKPANRRRMWDRIESQKKTRTKGKDYLRNYATKYRRYANSKPWKHIRCRGDEPHVQRGAAARSPRYH